MANRSTYTQDKFLQRYAQMLTPDDGAYIAYNPLACPVLDVDTMIGRRVTTWPWYWWGMPGDDGLLVASLRDQNSLDAPTKLYVFDLIDMGILDATGQHVLPAP